MKIKILRLFVATAVLFSLSACNNDEKLTDPFADGPVAMTFTADINNVATRAATTGFQEGDVVGIIPVKGDSVETAQANIAYVYDGSKFGAEGTPYYFQNRDKVTFNAYYPHKRDLSKETPTITIDTRITNQISENPFETGNNSWRKNDYLFAVKETNVETPSISFTKAYGNPFTHVMSSVAIRFIAGTDNGVPNLNLLTAYTLGNIVMDGTFDCSTGETALTGISSESITENDLTPGNVEAYTTTQLILLPQEVKNGNFPLTVKYNGVDYKATLELAELAAGTYYEFPVTIRNTGLEIGTAEIKEWERSETKPGEATLQ